MRIDIAVLIVSLGALGCSSSSSAGSSSCTNIAGTWKVAGACGNDTCVITQNGCSTNFACGGGSASYAGTVSGNDVSYSGTSGAGSQGSCTGTLSGASSFAGTCTIATGNCSFTATKQ